MGGKVSFPIVKLPTDRICLVTGANTGIGYEVAKWLAMMGARVILACRSEDKAMEAIRRMDTEYKDLKEKGTDGLADLEQLQLEYMHLDLSSFQSVRDFVGAFKLSGRQLHVLICNAGVCKAKLETTDDGFEAMLQVNYLGHFLLIGQLLPVMKRSDSDDVRIVLVSSDMHRWPKYDLSQMNYSGDPAKYSMFTCYGNSKLYQVMQMYSLQRRLKNTNISITSAHPGDVDTEIGRDYVDSKTWQLLLRFSRLIGTMRTPIEGANSVLYAAVHPDLKGVSGKYFKDCKDGYTTAAARDEVKQEALWKQTLAYLKDHLTEEDIFCLEGADPEAENT